MNLYFPINVAILKRTIRVAWRVWVIVSVFLVIVVLGVVSLAYFGFDRQAVANKFPNELTTSQSSEGVERMRIALPYLGRHPPFVGVALSGGGSRAANFSLFVLEELDKIGLLEHVDTISSVSGGSLAAGEIALHLKGSPSSKFWNDAKTRLRTDFAAKVLWAYFWPPTFLSTFTTGYDRGDILATVLDRELYRHATFSDIASRPNEKYPGGYYPSVIVNATAVSDPLFQRSGMQIDPRLPIGTYMSTFSYTFERFSEMSSSLASMPVAYAVASSAAFPAAINPVTLQLADVKREGPVATFVAKRYIHLADGGLSDNLGTDTLRKVYESRMAYQRVLGAEGKEQFVPRPCLIVAIDATSPPKYGPRLASLRPDGRTTWWSSFIDATAVYGYDAYLLRRRADQLDEMGIDSASVDYGKWVKSRPTAVVETKIRARYSRFQEAHMYRAAPSVFTRTQTVGQPGLELTFDFKEYVCTIWHIALEDLDVRRPETYYSQSERQFASDNAARNRDLRSIADTALSLTTDFKLSSITSPRCTPEQLQSVLKRAAQELVLDSQNKSKVCRWMKSSGFEDSRCRLSPDDDREMVPMQCIDRVTDPEADYISRERFGKN